MNNNGNDKNKCNISNNNGNSNMKDGGSSISNVHFCCFDFSGTGLSQGKYVSLGYYQKYDIQAII